MPLSPIKLKLPRVAILGSPNVGKSTLYNRLLGKRRSITHSQPGVTRDPVEAECKINEKKVILIDTGGFSLEKEGLNTIIAGKSVDVAKQADVLLLLLDINGISGEDQDFIEKLRPFQDKLILVANKVDTEQKEDLVWNMHSLGFPNLVSISAEHGRNIDILKNEISSLLIDNVNRESETNKPEITISILGKPNTGKSTLLNHILGQDKALVTNIPGTTRDVIQGCFNYKNKFFQILDTAGIRRKKKVTDAIEYYSVNRAIKSIDRSDIVILVTEAQEQFSEQDKKIAQLVVNKGRGLIIVINKWDLIKKIPNQEHAYIDRIKFLFPIIDYVPIIPISALTGLGIEQVLNKALIIWKQLNMRVETAVLNNNLGRWMEEYPIPYKWSKYKIRYFTQVGTNPLKFILFVNQRKGFPITYLKYLNNRIKKDLGFNSVPHEIELRQKTRKPR